MKRFLLVMLVVDIAIYLAGAFINLELNPLLWDDNARQTAAFSWLIVGSSVAGVSTYG